MQNSEKDLGKLQLLALKDFESYEDMYKIVDFLNKSLRERKLMFGLSKNQETDKMVISIYEV